MYPAARNAIKIELSPGAGGPGPAGGGGGSPGSGDRGGSERLQYIALRTPVPDAAASVAPPTPIVPPKPVPTEQSKPPVLQPAAPSAPASGSIVPGTGPGTGGAGPGGSGPGSGGGTGSGIGTGTGSGIGPGTGGSGGQNYDARPTQLFLPPLPAPPSLRGYHLTAYFDVDEKGSSKLLGFNPSPDGGYNRRLRDVLLAVKFRPGTRPDGTPVRDTVAIEFIF